MKPKSILLAVALALVTSTTATAFAVEERHTDTKAGQGEAAGTEEIGVGKPPKNNDHMKGKPPTTADGFKLDFEELFGCMPMEEKTNIPLSSEPMPEKHKLEPTKSLQEK